jgi:hypothetical protein
VSNSENFFGRLASALTLNHNLRELYLTSFPYKVGSPNDTSDAVYSALSGHCALRKIMVRPHNNTTEFVEACSKWRKLEFVFIELSGDEA